MGFCIPVFEALAVIFWGLILVLIIFWIFVLILCLNPVKHDSWNNKKIYITLACPVFFYILFCVSFLLFVTTSCFALIVCCCLSCLTFTFSLLLSWLSSTMPAFLPDSHSVLLSVCVCVCIMLSLPFSPGLYFCPSVKHLCPSHGARYFALFSVWVWISSFFFLFLLFSFFLFFCILNWIAFIASLNPQILTVWPSEIYVIISNNHNYIHLKKAKLTCWEKC